MPLALFALAVASFGIGTTEFVIMGLLPELARDLSVTIPQAGLLITSYALGVVVGGPIIAIATTRLPRKTTLIGLTSLFVVGNLLCAIAPNYALLMAARVITAFGHGAFFGIGSIVAASLVPRHQRARAMAMLFAGVTLANILGVPAGTALGQAFGWRSTFWVVVMIGLVSVAAIAAFVPKTGEGEAPASLASEFRVFRNSQVWLAMAISVVTSASLFAVFTYIAPILQTVTGISPGATTLVLLLFGAGITIGNLVGGRLADWRLMETIIGALALLAIVMLQFTLASHHAAAATATVFVWGVVFFALIAPLQMRVVECASAAPNLASTLNQGAFNLGNALGAWIGGTALTFGLDYDRLPILGALLATLALGIALQSWRMGRRRLAAVAAE
ncbi:MFS transporter, DHA1 family, arabinose polymer transporter [Kaistia soli DSM 19436]|uniref:MFS transporter, DHA1 family, arabinose polymer transporter n=1 Tax=Kaistia soli DSM 19436 TaxID=1122133 RepID=A0A1M4ZCY1_9HYPH|nr:MFS transporter [Kaistia soli]SHF15871.1 MFS transporter, DHA1 family, arabinose polymer transporter [Kaistia soli DSM 19436]